MIGRLGHYLPIDRRDMPVKDSLPKQRIEDFLTSANSSLPPRRKIDCWLMSLRSLAKTTFFAPSIRGFRKSGKIRRPRLSNGPICRSAKRKVLYENSVGFFGAP